MNIAAQYGTRLRLVISRTSRVSSETSLDVSHHAETLTTGNALKSLISSHFKDAERDILSSTHGRLINETAPNSIGMSLKQHQRQGMKAIVPSFNTKAQSSVATHYDNSFGVKAARLWNILPKAVNEMTTCTLDSFKVALGNYIEQLPDTPPTKGYTATNNNSLLEWNAQRGSTVGGRT